MFVYRKVLFYKKGGGPLMATVLFVVIVLALVSAIALALVPVIKKSFSSLDNCLDAQSSLDIVKTRLTCYDASENLAGLTVKVNKEGMKKFRVAFTDDLGSSKVFDVTDGQSILGFAMFGFGQPGSTISPLIQFPEEGAQLTYIASGSNLIKAEIAPIVKKEVCPIDDVVDLNPCAPDVNLAQEPLINVYVSVRKFSAGTTN